MPDYQKLYTLLFHACTDARMQLELQNFCAARHIKRTDPMDLFFFCFILHRPVGSGNSHRVRC